MPWGAAIAAVAAIGGAYMNSESQKDAQEDMMNQTRENREYIADATGRAEDSLLSLFPAAQAARREGNQAALGMFMQQLPTQTQLFQEGNLAAQNQTINALPQMQNALMGNPVNQNFQAYRATLPQMQMGQMNAAPNARTIVNQATAERDARAQAAAQATAVAEAQAIAKDKEERNNMFDHLGGWETQLIDKELGVNEDHDWHDFDLTGWESNFAQRYF